MSSVTVELRNIAGTEAAVGWAGAYTIVVDRLRLARQRLPRERSFHKVAASRENGSLAKGLADDPRRLD